MPVFEVTQSRRPSIVLEATQNEASISAGLGH